MMRSTWFAGRTRTSAPSPRPAKANVLIDGRWIAFDRAPFDPTRFHKSDLYLMRSDGSRKTRITFTDGFDGLPVFSPDGKYLMWSSKRSKDRTTQIFLARFRMPRGA